ncbi:DUF6542 domain-containing protein [Streptomyces sp. NPDC092296]|uniref:DUF6542 domain-containing protein n=1 Tax=Streptomyces sp. NPDC092296 TaxID=3366012 RepID=UPI00380DEB0A
MEQQRTRSQPPRPRSRSAAGGAPKAAVPGPAGPREPVSRGRLRLPGARPQSDTVGGARGGVAPSRRLTAVGVAVVAMAATLLGALADHLLLGGLGVLFGLVYVAVCFQVAVRVRRADLPAAPISGPIAFALALLVLGPSTGHGFGGHLMALAAGLATHAGWLFTGTGLAAAIVAARYLALRRSRRR